MTDQQAQIRDDALSVLRDMLEWSLSPARWEEIAGILDGLGSGLGTGLVTGLDLADPGQLAALTDATVALELAGPVRITRIDTSAAPAPDRVRDRVNQLIHALAKPGENGDANGEPEAGR